MNTEGLLESENSFYALASTMGNAVLVETLKLAAYYVCHSNGTQFKSRVWNQQTMKEAKGCYIFIQGTGLQGLIDRFGLAYEADLVVSNFNYCVRHSV